MLKVCVGLVLLASILLTGCGFQLRGSGVNGAFNSSVTVVTGNQHSGVSSDLESVLRKRGVELYRANGPAAQGWSASYRF